MIQWAYVLRNGVASSCVRMKKSLPSHALNNRENFSPTKLEWDPGNKAMWPIPGVVLGCRTRGGFLVLLWFPGRLQAHHLISLYPNSLISTVSVIMLKSFMRSAEIPWCLLYYWHFAGVVSLLQLLSCYSMFAHLNATPVVAMYWFLPHRVTVLYFVFQVKLQRKRRTSAEL